MYKSYEEVKEFYPDCDAVLKQGGGFRPAWFGNSKLRDANGHAFDSDIWQIAKPTPPKFKHGQKVYDRGRVFIYCCQKPGEEHISIVSSSAGLLVTILTKNLSTKPQIKPEVGKWYKVRGAADVTDVVLCAEGNKGAFEHLEILCEMVEKGG